MIVTPLLIAWFLWIAGYIWYPLILCVIWCLWHRAAVKQTIRG